MCLALQYRRDLCGLGEKGQALVLLEKAIVERFNWIPFIQVDPLFDGLRSERGFVELVKTIGLTQ